MNTEQILQSIVKDKSTVNYHEGWGFYIKTHFDSLKMIGLIPNGDNLELSFYFGETQSQSKSFYSGIINIEGLENRGWKLFGNFHLSSVFRNLIWFDTKLKPTEYIKFWRENRELLFQHSIKEVSELIDFLTEKKVIDLYNKKEEELEEVIYEKGYTRLNICAGFGAIYTITKSEIDAFGKQNNLQSFLVNKINEALQIIGKDGNEFLIISKNIEGDPPGL